MFANAIHTFKVPKEIFIIYLYFNLIHTYLSHWEIKT